AYASATGNMTLAAQVAINPSDLDTMSEQRIDDVANRVYAAVRANITALADYGVTDAKYTALNAARLAFQEQKSKPRAKISDKAGKTTALSQLIRDGKSLLRTRL